MKKVFWIKPVIFTAIIQLLDTGCIKEECVISYAFSSTLEAPIVETTNATNISSAGATLNCNVNAMGLSTIVIFDYSFFGDMWCKVPAGTITGNSSIKVSSDVFLRPFGSNYCKFRAVAENFYGVSYGSQMCFTY